MVKKDSSLLGDNLNRLFYLGNLLKNGLYIEELVHRYCLWIIIIV